MAKIKRNNKNNTPWLKACLVFVVNCFLLMSCYYVLRYCPALHLYGLVHIGNFGQILRKYAG
jgi:hypothetical protein